MKRYNQKRNSLINSETVWSKARWFSQKSGGLVNGRSNVTNVTFGAKLAERVPGRAKTVANACQCAVVCSLLSIFASKFFLFCSESLYKRVEVFSSKHLKDCSP